MSKNVRLVSRRKWLAGSAAACVAGGWWSVMAQTEEAVVDRRSQIQIKALVPIRFQDRVFIRIDTNRGISGWGEIKGVIPRVAEELAVSLFEMLDGQNPTRIEHIWQMLYRSERNQRGGAFMVHCISGIDMALWDIVGKLWGVPVATLLGGPTRDKIRVYPSANAVKLGSGPQRMAGNPAEIQPFVDQVRSTRARLGPEGTIMFDAHCAMPPAFLIQFANAVEPDELLFLEEPAVPGNIEVFKRLKQQIRIPFALGERDRTIWGILPYLEAGVVDIVQPDCGYTGGISQMKKIATLAEAYTTPLAPHCTQSYLGMTASFQVSAAVPHLLIHESYDSDLFARFLKPSWTKKDGYVTMGDAPGLGIEVVEAEMRRIASDPNYKYRWRGPRFLDDGSVTDY